ncbi:LysR family transcriptional regulator [Streptomyces sp. 796.1]|uniref:LysR family transcriptional regulator n=1 Tax=Streptomyces sp. 796.1 TaxID=3163029 RepID=UPI0039C917BD
MDLLQLRYFRAVARFEHISRAAEELCVAQPSVSRTIARLEAELGTALFDRQGRRIRLNQYGALFLRHVERALSELDDGRRAVADARDRGLGRVSIAAETLLTVSRVLGGFRAAYPDAAIRLHQSNAVEMERRLRVGDVDFCVASQPLSGARLGRIELMQESVLLVVPLGHRLAGRESVTVPELADEPFVVNRRGNWQRTLLDRLFAAEGLTPVVACEGDELGASHELIAAGLGIGLLPEMSRQAVLLTPLAWIRVDAPDCHRVLTLVWHRDAYLSEAALKFRDYITERPFMAGPAGSRAEES